MTISATALISLVGGATALAAWGAGVEASLPANAAPNTGASLRSVSCASAGNCTAVGLYDLSSSGDTPHGLLLTETAGSWSTGIEATLPANAGSLPGVNLPSVSCASAGNCAAVGTYDDSGFGIHGLLLSETAGSWSSGIEPTLPANSVPGFASPKSVACATPGSCTAVGVYADNATDVQGLLLTETAGTWSTGVEAALPVNAGSPANVNLDAVSCASAGNCTAAGSYQDSSGQNQGLLLTETAGVWSTGVEAALPANAGSSQNVVLNSVSCASAGNCAAVGSYFDGASGVHGLLLTETAGVWSPGVEAAPPANSGPGEALVSVSCASAGNCTAVGRYVDSADLENQGLLVTQTAGVWSTGVEATLPGNAGPTQNVLLKSVSCSSPGNCSAVGTYEDSSNDRRALLLTEASGTWSIGVDAPLPANALSTPFSSLNSVSCSPTGSCTAVGAYLDLSANSQGLIVSSAKAATSLTAAPQLAAHGAVGLGVASATLTSGGAGLPGQKITFTDGSLQLCTATTNSKGTATCLIPLFDELFVLLHNRYSATFAATDSYSGSTATTPALTR